MRLTRTLAMSSLGVSAALMLSACQKQTDVETPAKIAAVPETETWRSAATEQDRKRIRNWYSAWQAALSDARAKGEGARIDAEGVLLVPSAAMDEPALPVGDYRCRTLKLGAKGRSTLGFVSYDWMRCRVLADGDSKLFVKLTGSQRPTGRIYADGYNREVFLGTLSLGDELTAISYGSDRMRDMAGLIERIGDKRWRLVLPEPAYESLLDVIEIIPET